MMAMIGRSSGSVMCQKRCQALAPSTAACLVELARDALQRGMHQDDGERQRAPDVGHGDGVERGVGIAGPVDRIVDQAEREQDAVQEAELEAVDERPDQAVAIGGMA